MENESIEGIILIDTHVGRAPHVFGNQVFAGCTLPGVADIQVDWAGEITYAYSTDATGHRLWWFAGIGNVEDK